MKEKTLITSAAVGTLVLLPALVPTWSTTYFLSFRCARLCQNVLKGTSKRKQPCNCLIQTHACLACHLCVWLQCVLARERERDCIACARARAPFARKRFRVSVQAGPSRRRGMLGSRAERILKGSYAVVQIRVLWVIDLGLQSSWCFFLPS